jgi:hypothetical protein
MILRVRVTEKRLNILFKLDPLGFEKPTFVPYYKPVKHKRVLHIFIQLIFTKAIILAYERSRKINKI